MKIIGITGGVGAGKSLIMSYLSEHENTYIAEADKIAKELYLPGNTVYEKVLEAFSEFDICDEKGVLDKMKLSKLVFNDSDKLQLLNDTVHPAVREEIMSLIKRENELGRDYFFLEAAILIESGYKDICDEIWYVYASPETRINRLIKSRGYSREKCLSVISSQKSDDFFRKYSDHVINNDRPFEEVKRDIDKLME